VAPVIDPYKFMPLLALPSRYAPNAQLLTPDHQLQHVNSGFPRNQSERRRETPRRGHPFLCYIIHL
jgi:hypothetical protein